MSGERAHERNGKEPEAYHLTPCLPRKPSELYCLLIIFLVLVYICSRRSNKCVIPSSNSLSIPFCLPPETRNGLNNIVFFV